MFATNPSTNINIFAHPFVPMTPNRVKTKFRIGNSDAFALTPRTGCYTSEAFSFPARNSAIWKLNVLLNQNWFSSVELILVYSVTAVYQAKGTIDLLNIRQISFGPKNFGTLGEKLTIDVGIARTQLQDIELHIEIPSLQDLNTKTVKPCILSDDLSKMLLAKNFSDVTLEVEGEDIPAHKVILSARSSVFMAMFQSGMQEEQNSRVSITDVAAEVVKELLRYAYTGVLEKMESLGPELMIAADKYNMIDLKNRCRDWLLNNLSTETAPRLLLLADSLNDEVLMEEVIAFAVVNLPKVLESSEWSSLTSERPMLMENLLKAVSTMKITP